MPRIPLILALALVSVLGAAPLASAYCYSRSLHPPVGPTVAQHKGLHDEESGLVYNRARMLSPGLGRFAQRDRAGYRESYSLYEYARTDPILRRDLTGLTSTLAGADACDDSYNHCISHPEESGGGLSYDELVGQCWQTRMNCISRLIPPHNPMPSASGACNFYAPNATYRGAYMRCFCECMGDSDWSNEVRSCLQALAGKGVSTADAHVICYGFADWMYPSQQPTSTLAYCYASCNSCNPFNWF